MYRKNDQIVDHFQLHREVTKVLQDYVFRRLELASVMPAFVVKLLASQNNLDG